MPVHPGSASLMSLGAHCSSALAPSLPPAPVLPLVLRWQGAGGPASCSWDTSRPTFPLLGPVSQTPSHGPAPWLRPWPPVPVPRICSHPLPHSTPPLSRCPTYLASLPPTCCTARILTLSPALLTGPPLRTTDDPAGSVRTPSALCIRVHPLGHSMAWNPHSTH